MPPTVTNLFDTGPEPKAKPTPAFRLWYMPAGKRSGWECVFEGPTEFSCVSAMADDRTRRHGKWYILPASQTP